MTHDWTTSGPDLHLALASLGTRHAALEDALRSAIREGRLAAGTRLPSTRALAGDLGLSRGTVVEAFAQLAAEGYLDARHGAGTWVAGLALPVARPGPVPERPRRAARFCFSPGLPDLTSFPEAAWIERAAPGAARRVRRDARLRRSARPAASCASSSRPTSRGRAGCAPIPSSWSCARASGTGSRSSRGRCGRAAPRRSRWRTPACPSTAQSSRQPGSALAPLPVDERGARTDLLDAALPSAAVLSPAHQFPTGVVLHPDRRAAAIAWATATGGLIVEDDYDGELRYDRQPVGALQALARRTTWPTAAPPARRSRRDLRLGWLVVPPHLLEAIVRLRSAEDVHVPAPEQIALCRAAAPRASTSATSVVCARATAAAATGSSRCSPSARPRLAPVGISAGLGGAARASRGRADVRAADRRGGAPIDRAGRAGAALPRWPALRATAS